MATLKAQLVEKQTVQTENSRLKLQLESIETQCKVEQRKAGEERSETTKQRLFTYVLNTTVLEYRSTLFKSQRPFISLVSLTGTPWPS